MDTKKRIIALNNAATTAPFPETLKAVNNFLQSYGAFHRGAGPNATKTYEKVHEAIVTIRKFMQFKNDQSLLFTQNTSAAINLFVRMLLLKNTDVVITSDIEHTSNYLPWRFNSQAKLVFCKTALDGSIDMDDLAKKADIYKKHLRVIAITGASNLTGYIPNLKQISRIAHMYGALLFVDAAQLAPHRQLQMRNNGVDALAFSAHKLYAPFGFGVLAGPKNMLSQNPVDPAGGSINMISDKEIIWSSPDHRHQSGTWNVTGIIALARSCEVMMKKGWPRIMAHEHALRRYAVRNLQKIKGLRLMIDLSESLSVDRIGTIPFVLDGYHHALVSAILEHEYGIETRSGTICNHRLVRRWFNISDAQQKVIERKIRDGNLLASYGIVRVSIGVQNTKQDIDALVNALTSISKSGPRLQYKALPKEEVYIPL